MQGSYTNGYLVQGTGYRYFILIIMVSWILVPGAPPGTVVLGTSTLINQTKRFGFAFVFTYTGKDIINIHVVV